MDIVIVILVSFFTAFLFDFLSITKTVKYLFVIQRESFKVIADRTLTDDQKQKALLSYTLKIFLTSIKLLFLFFSVITPFTFLVLFGHFISKTNNFYGLLMSVSGILITSASFLIYFYIKKRYGRDQV